MASSWKTYLLGHLRRLLLVWVVLCVGMAFGQRRVMYLPESERIAPASVGLTGVREATLATPDGEQLVVWRAPASPGHPTIIYFHGNGDALATRGQRVGHFQAAGYGIHMHAYRGFSGSTGHPAQPAILADALLAYDAVRADGIAPENIVIYGESLGTSVATYVAVNRPAAGLILEAPFTSMVAAWQQFVPFLPVDLLLHDRYETDQIIGQLKAPLLILHGAKDRLVRVDMGRALFARAPDPKRIVVLPEAAHMNAHDHGAMEHIRSFIRDLGFPKG